MDRGVYVITTATPECVGCYMYRFGKKTNQPVFVYRTIWKICGLKHFIQNSNSYVQCLRIKIHFGMQTSRIGISTMCYKFSLNGCDGNKTTSTFYGRFRFMGFKLQRYKTNRLYKMIIGDPPYFQNFCGPNSITSDTLRYRWGINPKKLQMGGT